ncbi:hypothetical protein ACT43X_18750 (plasmid) [Acinetobacter baumannii]
MKNLKTTLVSIALISMLSACSKPDITGTWIPESVKSDDNLYTYYDIKKIDGTERLSLIKYIYKIRPSYEGGKAPIQLDEPTTKVLEFTKDNTYCVEGSLNTECVVSVDGGKLDVYNNGRFKKSESTPPKIPVNKY